MIDALLSSPATRMLEQAVDFTEQRHDVIAANIANASTPGYVQQDVSVTDFQQALQDAMDQEQQSFNGESQAESNEGVTFYPGSSSVTVKPRPTKTAMAFHDRGVRSMESLMGDLADNALAHNTLTQLLKSRYDWVTKAISMRA